MKVRVHPGDQSGCGWYRIRYPARAARREGIEIEQAKGLPMLRRAGDGAIAPDPALDADVLVFQRPSDPELVALIPSLQARGHAVVVDVDDDLAALDARNLARGHESGRMVARACALADLVTVATPALARRYGAHGRVIVLRNCVPGELLSMPRDSDGRSVGWAGWVGTHPGDLQVTHGAVQQALDRTGGRFLQIGPLDGVQQALGLREQPEATGGLPIRDYLRALGRLDVAICPLADSAFNRAKSALKPLELAARGAAVVMSPRPEYERLADEGIGVLASERSRHWRARISELLSDTALRREMTARAYDRIAASHTYETEGWRWAEAWAHAGERPGRLRSAA